MGGGEHHLLCDPGGAHVERAAEDERESEDVVYLVGIVGPSGGHDKVLARGDGQFVVDFGIGIGQREDHGPGGHCEQHLRRHAVGYREPDEDVGPGHRLGQGPRGRVASELRLVLVHTLGTARIEDALGVAHQDVLELRAEANVVIGAGDRAGAGARKDDLHVAKLLAHQFHGVQQRRAGDDGGAMLVVVEDRDAHGALQLFLDFEAFRGLDVFEVDAAERRLHQLAGADHLLGILGVQFDVEHIDVGEALEQDALALHNRLAGRGPDVAQAEHGGAVGDHAHEVALGRVVINQRRVAEDFETRHGHAGRIGQAQVALRAARFRGCDGDLARRFGGMVLERFFFTDQHT